MNEKPLNKQGPNTLFPAYHEFCEKYKIIFAAEGNALSSASGGGAIPPSVAEETFNPTVFASAAGGGPVDVAGDGCGR